MSQDEEEDVKMSNGDGTSVEQTEMPVLEHSQKQFPLLFGITVYNPKFLTYFGAKYPNSPFQSDTFCFGTSEFTQLFNEYCTQRDLEFSRHGLRSGNERNGVSNPSSVFSRI